MLEQPKNLAVRLNRFYNTKRYLVFIGGSNNDKTDFQPLIDNMQETIRDLNYISFTFRPNIGEDEYSIAQQIQDTIEVLNITINDFHAQEIIVFATSMGAYAATKVLTNKDYDDFITTAIYYDPADYYVDETLTNKSGKTWSGDDIYAPTSPTISQSLKKMTSQAKVHVINSTLRNYLRGNYVSEPYRGDDNLELFSRLNNDMVKAFYKHLPKINKGKFIETNTLPHAFLRDGYVKRNIDQMRVLIEQLI